MADPSTAVEDVFGVASEATFPWLFFWWTSVFAAAAVWELVVTRHVVAWIVCKIANRFLLSEHTGLSPRQHCFVVVSFLCMACCCRGSGTSRLWCDWVGGRVKLVVARIRPHRRQDFLYRGALCHQEHVGSSVIWGRSCGVLCIFPPPSRW